MNSLTETLQLLSHISVHILVASAEFTKENQSDIFLQVQFDIGIIFLNCFDFSDQFLDKQGQRKFHLQRSIIFWKSNYSVFLDFNYLLDYLRNFNYSREENKLLKLRKETFNLSNLSLQGRISSSELTQISQKKIELHFNIFSQQFIFLLVTLNINSNSDSKSLLFNNFMNILEDFNYLRHHNYLFDYFFKNEWHLNKPLFMHDNFYRNINHSINYLQYFLDMIDISHRFFELFKNNSLLYNFFYFFHTFILVTKLNYFFMLCGDFFHFLHYDRYLHYLLNDILDISVHIDQLRNHFLDLYYLWHFNDLLLNFLDLINFRNYY